MCYIDYMLQNLNYEKTLTETFFYHIQLGYFYYHVLIISLPFSLLLDEQLKFVQ